MDNQTKIIFGLLALIAILVGVFVLKITGIIKPAEREKVKVVENIEKTEQKEENINTYDTDIVDNYEEVENKSIKKNDTDGLMKTIKKIEGYTTLVTIILFIVKLFITIGIAKLYTKLSMPEWIISYQYLSVFISLFRGFLPNSGKEILSTITEIISIIIIAYYFSAAGMSKVWAVCPTLSLILSGIGLSIGLRTLSLFGLKAISILSLALSAITLIAIVAFWVAYIISNIRIAHLFKKGIGFKIGIAIFPSLFQAILGYQNNRSCKNIKIVV